MRTTSRAVFFATAFLAAPLAIASALHPSPVDEVLVVAARVPTPSGGIIQDAYEQAKVRYEECMRRLPLLMHTRGREALAESRDPRALELLASNYAKPNDPREQTRNLIVGICARRFNDVPFVDRWIQWRLDNDAPNDAYLWYRALYIEARQRGPESVVAVATDSDLHPFLRAAALRALADNRSPVIVDIIPGLCIGLPKKEEELHAMVGAMGMALLSQKSSLGDDAFQKAAEAYAHLLDAEYKLAPVSLLTVSRYLGQCLGIDQLYLESGLWILKIKAKGAVADTAHSSSGGTTGVKPSFFGLEATGTNIVYVIDMSDSMCKPIDRKLKPSGPVTGAPQKKRKKGDIPTVEDIPWDRVESRFDLAREHLKISLQRLGKEKRFAVVFFGDRGNLIDACPGMMDATPQNVMKAIKELDAIVPGPATTDRPDGTLRGMTNLHAGLRRAFQVRSRGLADSDEHIDAKASIDGADTIFLLSDGDPTWDDWDKVDRNYGEDQAGDPESRVEHQQLPNMHYSGPYRSREHLIPDVARMNLFRSVEIHCIAIGEVDITLLEEIARIGLNGKTHAVK